jgi:ABC-type glycerol-3-phosphate transport system substrate-binding protein
MTKTIFSRREMLKQGTAIAGAASLPAWCPRQAWAAKPQITVWIITYLNPKADEIIQSQFAELAKEANAAINVEMVPDAQATKKLKAAVTEGNPPDLAMFFDTDYFYYRSTEQLLEVTDLLDEMKKEPAELLPRAVEGVEEGGKAYGIPAMMNPWPIHWRKDLLEKAGLEYPKDIFEFSKFARRSRSLRISMVRAFAWARPEMASRISRTFSGCSAAG